MAASVVGYAGVREGYGTGTFTRQEPLPAGTLPGDVLVYCAMIAGTAPHDTTGWTVLRPMMAVGTRSYIVMARQYTTGTTVPVTFTSPGGGGHSVGIVALRGVDLAAVVAGATWTRAANGTGSTDRRTIGLGVPYTKQCVVLSMHGEAGTGVETENPYVTVVGGAVIGVQDYQGGGSGSIEKVLAAASTHTGSGTSPDHVATWQNTGANNGIAVALMFPAASTAPTPTGNVLHASAAQPAAETLRVSARMIDPARTVVAHVGAQAVPLTIDTGTGYGWADLTGLGEGPHTVTLTVDDVTQTDWTGTYRLLPTGAASYVAVTGSCQVTGSDHPVFDRMADDDPLFLDHMGDLHYADATTEAGWRAGMNTSLEAPRVRALTAGTLLHWQWDNHDRIIVDTLNNGSTDPATLTQWRKYAGPGALAETNARTWVAGRVRYVSTDFWTVRDDPDLVPEPRTMLGAAQKAWLFATLEAAEEPVIVWFTQWTGQNNANGRWNTFDTESDELEAWVNAHPSVKARLILIGGDSHSLQADSGTRTGTQHRFQGVPNLNVSGFNQAAPDVSGTITPPWDIACRTLQDDPATQSELRFGAYSRITIDDDGHTIGFRWEAVRVDGDDGTALVLATYERRLGTVEVDGQTCTVWSWDAEQGRAIPLAVEVAPEPDPLPEGLAARWTFDDPANLGTDAVAGRTLAMTSAVAVAARGGYALGASGSSGTGQTMDGFLNRDGFTIAALLKSPSSTGTPRIEFLDGSGIVVADLQVQQTLVVNRPRAVRRASVYTGGSTYAATLSAWLAATGQPFPTDLPWLHLAATYDGDVLRLYVDGVEAGTNTNPSGLVADPATFRVTVNGTNALFDDVDVWSYPLTAAEVAALAAAAH